MTVSSAHPEDRFGSGESIRTEKVAERVAKHIFADIVAKGLQPGDMLPPESALIASYQTGRASLREAIWLLEIYGVIRMKAGPKGGAVVGALRTSDFARLIVPYTQVRGGTIDQLVEARSAMEPLMARMAATAIDTDGARQLRDALEVGQQSIGSTKEWGRASARFHELIGELSGNVMLSLFNGSLTSMFIERVRTIWEYPERPTVHKAHQAIGDAIVKGNAKRAESLMADHLTQMISRVRILIPGLLEEVIEWR